MNIIKRSGEEVTFDGSKIVAAVEKANHEVTDDKRLSDAEIDGIAECKKIARRRFPPFSASFLPVS